MSILSEAWLQVVATAVGTLMATSNGMSYGWTSPMVPYFTGNSTHILISHQQAELLETLYLYGAAAGLPTSILAVNRYGRKSSMIISSLMGCIGWIMILCTYNLYVIYVARFMAGVAGNMVFIGAPMYIAEIAEPRIRGSLSASIYTMQLLGFVIVYSAGSLLPFYVVHLILKTADSAFMSSSMAGILFSVIMLLSATIASVFMDKFGRKSLLITSGLLTGIALTIMTIYFQFKFSGYDVKSISWIPIVCVMSYAATFKLGLGIVPIVVTAEIFSAKVKALGMTIADLFYVFPAIASISIYTILVDNYGIHVPFYVFSISSFVAVGLIYWLVPETKGKTLEEIQLMLKGHHKTDMDEQQDQNALKNLIIT